MEKKKKISLEIFSEGKKRSLKGEYIKVYKITGGVGGRWLELKLVLLLPVQESRSTK